MTFRAKVMSSLVSSLGSSNINGMCVCLPNLLFDFDPSYRSCYYSSMKFRSPSWSRNASNNFWFELPNYTFLLKLRYSWRKNPRKPLRMILNIWSIMTRLLSFSSKLIGVLVNPSVAVLYPIYSRCAFVTLWVVCLLSSSDKTELSTESSSFSSSRLYAVLLSRLS
jgi:hypothetical protein